MKKIYPILLFLIIFILFSTMVIPLEGDKYEKWLEEEVFLLITAEEEKEFNSLQTDKDKDRFITQFWAKRDPTPQTERNETQELYYRRLHFADENFSFEGVKGSKRWMGKVYIILGSPKRRDVDKDAWVYDPIPAFNLKKKFQVVFFRSQKEFWLDREKTDAKALQLIENFKGRLIVNPDLKELPKKDALSLDAEPIEDKIIQSFEKGNFSHSYIPLGCPLFLKKGSERTFLIAQFILGEKKMEPGDVVVFGRLTDTDGVAKNFRKAIAVKPEDPVPLTIRFRFPVKQNTYTFFYGARDAKGAKYTLLKKEIEVPDFWNNQLNLSSIFLTDDIEKADSSEKDSDFVFGEYKAVPKKDNVFQAKGNLYVFYQVYNPEKADNMVSLVERIELGTEERKFEIPERDYRSKVKENQVVFLWTSVPLSYLNPGMYRMTVIITDKIAQESVAKKVEFQVVE